MQQQYGAPPPQQYIAAPTPPSPGYDLKFQIANVNTTREVEALYRAMKGMGTDETQLISTLRAIPDPPYMGNLRQTYHAQHKRDLLSAVHSETSGYFREGLEALIRGPLAQDVHLLHEALSGAGTNEHMLNDVLLARSNADMYALKQAYHSTYHHALDTTVHADLSHKTATLFDYILAGTRAEESAQIIPAEQEAALTALHAATSHSTDQLTVCRIFAHASDGQLRALSGAYAQRHGHALTHVVDKSFSGHMRDALLRMLHAAEDRAMADAVALEEAMAGAGTKDRLLVNRVVRLHWQRTHLGQVKGAYRVRFKRELETRVKGETSKHYQDLMLALLQ